jgi:hypothetical protein
MNWFAEALDQTLEKREKCKFSSIAISYFIILTRAFSAQFFSNAF